MRLREVFNPVRQGLRRIFRVFGSVKRFLTSIAVVLTFLGLVTFALFIFEESLQIITFGTWPAQDAGDWELVLEGIDLLESTNKGMKVVTYGIGWVQPLAFFSYRAYTKSTDYYIKGLTAKTFARAPHVFDGREIEFNFTPARTIQEDGKTKMINRNVIVVGDATPDCARIKVKGVVKADGDKVIIEILSTDCLRAK